jgi:hypothetical protein
MGYIENILTQDRRSSELFFTRAIAKIIFHFVVSENDWQNDVESISRLCSSSQAKLLQYLNRNKSRSEGNQELIYTIDDFLIMAAQAYILMFFQCGFYMGDFSEIDKDKLRYHLGLNAGFIPTTVDSMLGTLLLDKFLKEKSGKSFLEEDRNKNMLNELKVIKRRHWNQYVTSSDNLYIPITPKSERISSLIGYFISSLQENYERDIFYNLLFNNHNDIIKSLYTDTIEKIKNRK